MSEGALQGVVAERGLEVREAGTTKTRVVMVRIGRPEPDPEPGGDWRCPLQITGVGGDEIFYAYGVDAVQALQLGFLLMGVRLEDVRASGFELTWLGGRDLGFPIDG